MALCELLDVLSRFAEEVTKSDSLTSTFQSLALQLLQNVATESTGSTSHLDSEASASTVTALSNLIKTDMLASSSSTVAGAETIQTFDEVLTTTLQSLYAHIINRPHSLADSTSCA